MIVKDSISGNQNLAKLNIARAKMLTFVDLSAGRGWQKIAYSGHRILLNTTLSGSGMISFDKVQGLKCCQEC